VGGRTISGTYEGFTYAKGTEYLGEPEYALKRIVNELGLDAVEIPEPMDGRYYNEWFYYGYDELEEMMVEYSSQAEFNRFVRLLLSYYNSGELEDVPEFNLNSQLAALDTITAREWFIENGFSSIYQEVYNVSSRGLFGASIDEISALSFLPELAFDYVDSSASNPYAADQAEEGSGAYSFKTGITEVTDAIANHLGDKIRLNSTVKNVTLENDIYTVSYEGANKNTVAIQSKTVILAVPASIALQIASGVLSAEQKSIMRQISYAPYITVALFSDKPIFNKAFDLAVPDNYFFTDIYDSTWIQRSYDDSLTNKKKYIISIYIAAQSYKDETLLGFSDSEVLANIYTRLDLLFPGVSNKVTGYDIHRFSYGYPVMTRGAYTRLTRLHKITTGGLQLAGDYMVYPTFEAAVESGFIAAEKIDAELNRQRSP
jgi:protoporphyrinogen oxidase